MSTYTLDKIRGSLFGLAFGDALGAETEFQEVQAIIEHWPPDGPNDLYGNPARVTDDTQMAIAVGRGIINAKEEHLSNPVRMEQFLRKEFIRWYISPDNDRAPGLTCLRACENLLSGTGWQQATIRNSKGCGANMRVAPVAFLPSDIRGIVAQFQGALTHGHPTALAASDLTAFAISSLASGTTPSNLIEEMWNYIEARRTTYDPKWLGDLWKGPTVPTPAFFINQGWEECSGVLNKLENALEFYDGKSDPCLLTGEGWTAEDAFATGLLCFLAFPDNPIRVLQRAATTCGDSDSIACLAGAFCGAYHGESAWPAEWYNRIEYKVELDEIADGLSGK